MTRKQLSLLAAAMFCGGTVAPVAADEFFVGTDGNSWIYNGQINQSIVLEIHPGDSVTWEWLGFHNVVSGIPSQGAAGRRALSERQPRLPGLLHLRFRGPGRIPVLLPAPRRARHGLAGDRAGPPGLPR